MSQIITVMVPSKILAGATEKETVITLSPLESILLYNLLKRSRYHGAAEKKLATEITTKIWEIL